MLSQSHYATSEARNPRSAADIEAPRRVPSVLQTQAVLVSSTDQLIETINELQNRLGPVLCNNLGAGSVREDAKCPQPCELATALSEAGDRVSQATERLRDIIERLEV